VSDAPTPAPFVAPRLSRWVVPGVLLGALVGAGCGAWDAWATFHSRERQDDEIRSKLEGIHPDGPRFYARVFAVRYMSLESLLAWRAGRAAVVGGLVSGFGALFVWLGVGLRRERRAKRDGTFVPDPTPPRGFTLIELLAVIAILSALFGLFVDGPSGLVYHNGKDQTRWLMQLHSSNAAERAEAVEAVCFILDNHRCYCREATVKRLDEMGAEAAPAVPVLRRLAEREPEFAPLVAAAVARIENPDAKP
jgi:prepilin-type N-terminal cleavage/methylation domain-containing protein